MQDAINLLNITLTSVKKIEPDTLTEIQDLLESTAQQPLEITEISKPELTFPEPPDGEWCLLIARIRDTNLHDKLKDYTTFIPILIAKIHEVILEFNVRIR